MEKGEKISSTNTPEDIQYVSDDIGKKTAVRQNYFTEVRKKIHPRDFIDYIFSGKRKIFTIGLAVAIVIASVLLVLWLTIWRHPSDSSSDTGASWGAELTSIREETYNILYEGDGENFLEALSFIDETIADATNFNQKFDLRIIRARFLNNNGAPDQALNDLMQIDEAILTDEQKLDYYLGMAFCYRVNGDTAQEQIYRDKIYQLPVEIRESIGE